MPPAETLPRIQSSKLDRPANNVRIVRGYRPGIISRSAQMHMDYYSKLVGFGSVFEAKVAGGLADLVLRLENDRNEAWSAVLPGDDGGDEEIVGTVFVDGEDLGTNRAHLRAFIVDDGVRGGGIGRQLLTQAVEFIDEKQFDDAHLTTFKGLDAARRLYEAAGFVLEEEASGTSWGREVVEQLFVRKRGNAKQSR